jgi:hypothetical protein
MITSDVLIQGLGNTAQRGRELMPSIFDGIEALDFQDIQIGECETWVKEGLTTVGVGMPTRAANAIGQHYASYVRAGYRKATPDDFRRREDGSPGCPLTFDEKDQAYIDGDLVLMVIDKRKKLGYQKADFIRANAPLWNKEQREQAAKSMPLSPRNQAALHALDKVESQSKRGDKAPEPSKGAALRQQPFTVHDKPVGAGA